MIPDGWIFPLDTPGSSQDLTCTSQSTLATRCLSRGIWCSWAVLCSVKLHWISLIQTCKQINTRPYQYQYKKKHMKNPWRWLAAYSLTFTVTAGAGRCSVQRWLSWSWRQVPQSCGSILGMWVLASPSPCSLSTASPARQEHKGGELLLICGFWARQMSTSVAWGTELGFTHKAV